MVNIFTLIMIVHWTLSATSHPLSPTKKVDGIPVHGLNHHIIVAKQRYIDNAKICSQEIQLILVLDMRLIAIGATQRLEKN